MMLMRSWWLVLHLLSCVHSFHHGAGACEGGKAVVSGAHLEYGEGSGRKGGSGSLEEGFTALRLAGTLAEAGKTLSVPTGKDIEWTLAANRVPIRGFLLRLEAPNGVETAAAITCGANQTLASVCTSPVIGCTHAERSDKFQVNGSFRFDEIAQGVKLDITVVYQNNLELDGFDETLASLFAYSQFFVQYTTTFTLQPSPGWYMPVLQCLSSE